MVRTREHLRRRLLATPPRLFAILIALCGLSLTLSVMFHLMYTVHVVDSGGHRATLLTYDTNPGELLALSGMSLGEGDTYTCYTYRDNNMGVEVQRAFPVYLNVDGSSATVRLTGGTVQDALNSAGAALGEHDYTEPSLNTPLTKDMSITVHRVLYKDAVTYEEIPFETEYQYTSLFVKNKSRTMTVQEGHTGTNEITHRQRWVDGEFESSQQIAIETTLQPQNTIIKAYAAGAPVSSLTGPEVVNGAPVSYRAMYTGRATGYSSKRGRGSSGLGLYYGTCAVNPALIPYGSKLYITSTDGRFVYGYAIATDTGGALQAGSALVDLYYETYSESVLNGVWQVNVYVVS